MIRGTRLGRLQEQLASSIVHVHVTFGSQRLGYEFACVYTRTSLWAQTLSRLPANQSSACTQNLNLKNAYHQGCFHGYHMCLHMHVHVWNGGTSECVD